LGNRWGDRFALIIMGWRIASDELPHRKIRILAPNHNGGERGESLGILLHGHNVVVLGDRPVGPKDAVFTLVNWGFIS